MDADSWKVIAHFLITIIAAVPGVIAAVSSLRNGKTLAAQNGRTDAALDPPTKVGTGPAAKVEADWYQPPNLN